MKKRKALTVDSGVKTAAQRDPDGWLTTARLCERWDKSPMTIWRYEHDSELNFPKPIRIKRRKHWRIKDIEEFEARAAGETVEAAVEYLHQTRKRGEAAPDDIALSFKGSRRNIGREE